MKSKSMVCSCKEFNNNNLNFLIHVATIVGYGWDGAQWSFCPWCGRRLTKRAGDFAMDCPACGVPLGKEHSKNCRLANTQSR